MSAGSPTGSGGPAPGALVGPYRLGRELGRGGMGVVYEAMHESIGRIVALKLLVGDLADESFVERFRREGRMQAALEHPHAVTIFEAGSSEHGPWLAMRLVRGTTLKGLIDEGALDGARTLRLLGQVAEALDAAHALGLVHRDVKPRNILVAGADHAYLADFGLTKLGDATGVTATGQIIGTLAYIAPEIVHGRPPGPASDRYALAAILFECLAGSPVFPRPTHMALLHAHASEPPPLISQRRPEVPAAVDGVLVAGLAKDPRQRPGSARELVELVRAALAGVDLGPPLPRVPVAPPSPAGAAAATPPRTAAASPPGAATATELPQAGEAGRPQAAAAGAAPIGRAGADSGAASTRPADAEDPGAASTRPAAAEDPGATSTRPAAAEDPGATSSRPAAAEDPGATSTRPAAADPDAAATRPGSPDPAAATGTVSADTGATPTRPASPDTGAPPTRTAAASQPPAATPTATTSEPAVAPAGATPTAPPASPPGGAKPSRSRRPNRGPVLIAALVGVLVGAAGTALLAGGDEAPSPLPPTPAGTQPLGAALAQAGRLVDCRGRAVRETSPSCTIFQDRLPDATLVVPRDGVVRQWVVRSAAGELALAVLRPREGRYFQIARSRNEFVGNAGPHAFPADLAVDRGDRLALVVVDGSGVGVRQAEAGSTGRWIPPLIGRLASPEAGPAGELLLRVDYAPGGRRQAAPRQAVGAVAARLPEGNELARTRARYANGERAEVVLVEVDGRGGLDLVRDGQRVARIDVPDLREPAVGPFALEVEPDPSEPERLGIEVGFARSGSARFFRHHYDADGRRFEFVD